MIFAVAASMWVAFRKELAGLDRIADSTWRNQTRVIERVFGPELGQKDLGEIRKSDLDLLAARRLQRCAPVTVATDFEVLAAFLNWCVDEDLVDKRPRFPTISVSSREEALPPDEAFRYLLLYLPQHHAGALEFMMLMGLSPHELERLQVCDASFGMGGVKIGGRPDFRVKQEVRRRFVPMNGRARILWVQATWGKPHNAHPFPRVDATEKAIQRLRENPPVPMTADTADITPKVMRSWFASKVANEQPEHVLQRLLGHARGSKVTRRHYVKSTDAQLVDATTKLSL